MLIELAAAILGSLGLAYLGLRWRYPLFWLDVFYLRCFLRILVNGRKAINAGIFLIDKFEQNVKRNPEKTFVIYQDKSFSYKCVNEQANRVARAALSLNLTTGETVAVFINNEPAFFWTLLGLWKVGLRVACINTTLRSAALLHCLKVSTSKTVIVGQDEDLIHAVEGVLPDLSDMNIYLTSPTSESVPAKMKSFYDIMTKMAADDVDPSVRSKVSPADPATLIFTSGTTGLPKPAAVSHYRAVIGGHILKALPFDETAILYCTLPLFHSAALHLATGNVITQGATLVLRKKFSASHFWEDCGKHKVTHIIYIGELCRYLVLQPPRATDRQHCVKHAVGNGLRADVWKEFQTRFGIENVYEYYGATEAPAIFMNLDNKFGSIGRIIYFAKYLKTFSTAFLKYDVEKEEPYRDSNGRCIHIKPGEEVGLFVAEITEKQPFDGYTGNKAATEKKILRDVFEKGDRYFNSGDLMLLDKDYYLYFKDRTGDTFRYKGENVSTMEVGNVLSEFDFVEQAVVYGVPIPGNDGKAGMAAICLNEEGAALSAEQLDEISKKCNDFLPIYARPRFLRIVSEVDMTATMKQQKYRFCSEGFDINKLTNQIYFYDITKERYVLMTEDSYQSILSGDIRA